MQSGRRWPTTATAVGRHRRGRTVNQDMHTTIRTGRGFIAALDQSGGSTPKALRRYGIEETAYADDAEMFDLVHAMRTRIITSPTFTGERILGRDPVRADDGPAGRGQPAPPSTCGRSSTSCRSSRSTRACRRRPTACRLMKPIPDLDDLLDRATATGCSAPRCARWSSSADRDRHRGRRRPAVRGRAADPRRRAGPDHRAGGRHPQPAEGGGRGSCCASRACSASSTASTSPMMLKLTLPEIDDFYTAARRRTRGCCGWWRCPAATPGTRPTPGWPATTGVIASFSRALTEGLHARSDRRGVRRARSTRRSPRSTRRRSPDGAGFRTRSTGGIAASSRPNASASTCCRGGPARPAPPARPTRPAPAGPCSDSSTSRNAA